MAAFEGVEDRLDFVDPFADFPDGPAGGLAAPVGDDVDGDVGQAEQGLEFFGDGGVLAVEDLGVGQVQHVLGDLGGLGAGVADAFQVGGLVPDRVLDVSVAPGQSEVGVQALHRVQAEAHSNYNTPPVFAIFVVLLVTRWLLDDIGGLAQMDAINRGKAAMLYRLLDESDGFYRGRAEAKDRSLMNVAFNLASPDLEKRFIAEALTAGFSGLDGHRAIGGIRASIYNGLTLSAVEELAGFMEEFKKRNA